MLSLLAACSFARTPPVACGGAFLGGDGPEVAQSAAAPAGRVAPEAEPSMLPDAAETRDRVADAIRAELQARPGPGPLKVRVLILSAGGQYGAFGAGFLSGWSENTATPRPDFDLVTGVSAGALLAPVAFAGSRHDGALAVWRGLSGPQVYRNRAPLALLGAPSLASTEPLERIVADQLTPGFLADMAARNAGGSRALISAVNLETTRAQVFDLGAVAGSSLSEEAKRRCLTEAMLASAAIPGLLPPRNIDGSLYADGGLRDQVFLTSLEPARLDVAGESARRIEVEARLVLNGALQLPAGSLGTGAGEDARDTLPAYVIRATTILADEVLRNSVRRVIEFARDRPDWRLMAVVGPSEPPCGDPERPEAAGELAAGAFDPCVTAALFDAGERAGRMVPIPWIEIGALERLARSPGAGQE